MTTDPRMLSVAPYGWCSQCGAALTRVEARDRSHQCAPVEDSDDASLSEPDRRLPAALAAACLLRAMLVRARPFVTHPQLNAEIGAALAETAPVEGDRQ